jgi:hypothetical protein
MRWALALGALLATSALAHRTGPARGAVALRSRIVASSGFFGSAAKALSDAASALGKMNVEEEVYDMMYGRRDRQWNPDRRTEEERKARFDVTASTLSWGGLRTDSEFTAYAREELPDDAPASNAVIRQDQAGDLDADALALLGLKDAVNAAIATDGPRPITGRELAELCFAKYSRYHDLAFVTQTVFGKSARIVSMNVYGPSLGFGAFKQTEAQYLEKLDSIAAALNDWGQAQFVRDFFLEAVKPRRGLPSRPRPDTAVTLRLNSSPTWGNIPPEKIEAYWQFL